MAPPTAVAKARVCTVATVLAATTLVTSSGPTEPWLLWANPMYDGGVMVPLTNAFMRQYLLLDLVAILARGRVSWDMVLHHVVCSTPYYSNANLLSVYVTLAEVFSAVPAWVPPGRWRTRLRIVALVPVRCSLFVHCMRLTYHPVFREFPVVAAWAFYPGFIVLALDAYWLRRMLSTPRLPGSRDLDSIVTDPPIKELKELKELKDLKELKEQ